MASFFCISACLICSIWSKNSFLVFTSNSYNLPTGSNLVLILIKFSVFFVLGLIFQVILTSSLNSLSAPSLLNLQASDEIIFVPLYLIYFSSSKTYVTSPSPLSSSNMIAYSFKKLMVSFLVRLFLDNDFNNVFPFSISSAAKILLVNRWKMIIILNNFFIFNIKKLYTNRTPFQKNF